MSRVPEHPDYSSHVQVSDSLTNPTSGVEVHDITTILFWARTLGWLKLKHQKLRVGNCLEEVLKWFKYLCARAHPKCKVSCCGVLNRLALLRCLCFIRLMVEKLYCAAKQTNSASLPSFRNIQSSLAVSKFLAAGEEQSHRWVCANL